MTTLGGTQIAYPTAHITKRGGVPAQSTYQQVNIQMPKFLPYPLGLPPPREQATLGSANNLSKEISLLNPIGGIGLASESQNHISLSALSKKPVPLQGRRLGVLPELMSTSSKDSVFKNKASPWSRSNADTGSMPVSIRVIGQSVDRHITASLQPDLSPGKVRKLRKILADSLDTRWTSEFPPRALRQRGVSAAYDGKSNAFNRDLVAQAQRLNFTIPKSHGTQYHPPEVQVQVFRNWLVELASCEMEYIWEDLGPLFWPRWIRRGVCLNNNQAKSCSWPPGMKCKPTGSRALKLLHWKCEEKLAEDIGGKQDTPLQPASRAWRTSESRLRRRTPKNSFYSSFQDMDPVTLDKGDFQKNVGHSVSGSSGIKHNTISLIGVDNSIRNNNIRAMQPRKLNIRNSRDPNWKLSRSRLPRGSLSNSSRKDKRQRRARRLIKRLSVTTNGHHCSWQVQNYLINDRCTCFCV